MGKHRTLAEDVFRAQMELERIDNIIQEKVIEILGMVFVRTGYCPADNSIGIDDATVAWITKEQQEKIYALGFQRIFLNHKDGSYTYFYKGGDPAGYIRRDR